jgi:alkanesulfonate monooxygenase SsuD/methylene tetrahydromethanopterin reductase-like flavin-dependent oxidoreductase (luciferase family)
MKYSTFMMPIHPPGRSLLDSLREDREAVILADQLGFSEAYVGEHVTDAAETITSSMIFLASLMAQTKHIMLGTGTLNLPNAHPAAIASNVAMLDHLLQGRGLIRSRFALPLRQESGDRWESQ